MITFGNIYSGGGGMGTVASVTSANADIAVVDPTVNPVLTLNSGTAANQIVKLNASAELPAVSGVNLTGVEKTANKDASNGYAGLTLLKINFKNVLNTFTSFFTNANTAARTYTFPDATGTVALTSDLTGFEQTANKDASNGYAGLTLLKINFKNVLNTFTSFFTNSNTAARTYTFPDASGTVALTSDLTDFIKKDGSVDYDDSAVQLFPTVGVSDVNVGSGLVEVSNATGVAGLNQDTLSIQNLATVESTQITANKITQNTVATGNHDHVIGGVTAGVFILDGANCLNVVIDGTPYKIAIVV